MEFVTYRRPLWILVPMALVLAVVTLVNPWSSSWWFLVLFMVVFGLLLARQGMAVTAEGVEVTVRGTRRIPWEQIVGFEAGSNWRGGVLVLTTNGRVRSRRPPRGGAGLPQRTTWPRSSRRASAADPS